MKKIILCVFIVLSYQAQSQIEKNTLFMGAFANPGMNGNLYYGHLFKNIIPSFGYMVNQKFALGVEGNMNNVFLKNPYYKSYNIEAFGRYYLVNEKKFAFYGSASIGFSSFEQHFSSIYPERYSYVVPKIGFGASYFLKDNLALDIQVNFHINKAFPFQQNDAKIGLSYYLRQRK